MWGVICFVFDIILDIDCLFATCVLFVFLNSGHYVIASSVSMFGWLGESIFVSEESKAILLRVGDVWFPKWDYFRVSSGWICC